MLGAIIGDIIGSPYEFDSDKTKDFPLFLPTCRPTDDSVLTVAVGCACAEADCGDEYGFKRILTERMREIGRLFPDAGYGKQFYRWLIDDNGQPYGGYTNGSAMRVSPVAWAVDSLDEVERLAAWSAEITHSHPDGVKGAKAVAAAVYLARTGESKSVIRRYVEDKYYDLSFTVDEIRPSYSHDMTCEGSVPPAIVSFLDATDYEDAVRNAISLGGDGDTMACIAGAIAEGHYGIPHALREQAFHYMDDILVDYYNMYAEILYPDGEPLL